MWAVKPWRLGCSLGALSLPLGFPEFAQWVAVDYSVVSRNDSAPPLFIESHLPPSYTQSCRLVMEENVIISSFYQMDGFFLTVQAFWVIQKSRKLKLFLPTWMWKWKGKESFYICGKKNPLPGDHKHLTQKSTQSRTKVNDCTQQMTPRVLSIVTLFPALWLALLDRGFL